MKRYLILMALVVLALTTTSAIWAQENPCNPCGPEKAANPCGGKAAAMPAVNPCHAKFGTVFYIADAMGRNTITFTSQAPLEDIVGTTNEITGYVVFDPKNPSNGGGAEQTGLYGRVYRRPAQMERSPRSIPGGALRSDRATQTDKHLCRDPAVDPHCTHRVTPSVPRRSFP